MGVYRMSVLGFLFEYADKRIRHSSNQLSFLRFSGFLDNLDSGIWHDDSFRTASMRNIIEDSSSPCCREPNSTAS